MNFNELKEFAFKLRTRLYEELNGRIKFTIYEEQQSITVHVIFKEFNYKVLIDNIPDKIYAGTTINDICDGILKDYRKQILKAFFKSDYKKRIDSERKLGIAEGYEL